MQTRVGYERRYVPIQAEKLSYTVTNTANMWTKMRSFRYSYLQRYFLSDVQLRVCHIPGIAQELSTTAAWAAEESSKLISARLWL